MSQTQLTSFFASRKRPPSDDIVSSKNKIPHLEINSTRLNNCKNKASFTFSSKRLNASTEKTINSTVVEQSEPEGSGEVATDTTDKTNDKIGKLEVFAKKTNTCNKIKEIKAGRSVETLNIARKELSLGDIRKKLASHPKFAEIKEKAETLSQQIQQFKEVSAKKNLKEFGTIDVEVPSSPKKRIQNELLSPKKPTVSSNDSNEKRPLMSPRKIAISPVKSPRKVSAYMKHTSLPTTVTNLPLPYSYRILGEMFRAMETVVAMLYNRNEIITFTKLKPSVQEMLRRDFTKKELGQIKNLVPDFYNFEMKKCKNFTTSVKKESYELIIIPNFPNEIKVMSAGVLLERRRYFFDTLLQIIKKHHAQFLLSLDPPMVIPDDKLSRWHPEFDIENTPEVECAKLPEPPNKETFTSAQDVLAKARELFKCNTKMERAMEKLAQAKAQNLKDKSGETSTETENKATSTNENPTTTKPLLNPALRNLPPALIEMVKAKQAAKALETMTRSSEDEKLYLIYSRLPDLAKSLRNIYVTERKNVLALNVVVSKLENSFKWVSAQQFRDDVRVLAQLLPHWLQLHDLRQTTYLKLDKKAKMDSIISKLEALIDKYKS